VIYIETKTITRGPWGLYRSPVFASKII